MAPCPFAKVEKVIMRGRVWLIISDWDSPDLSLSVAPATVLCPTNLLDHRPSCTLRKKKVQHSGYSIVINSASIFHTRNDFGCCRSTIAQLKLIKHKFPTQVTMHVYLGGFQITRNGVEQCTTCLRINYHNITNVTEYLVSLICIVYMI